MRMEMATLARETAFIVRLLFESFGKANMQQGGALGSIGLGEAQNPRCRVLGQNVSPLVQDTRCH